MCYNNIIAVERWFIDSVLIKQRQRIKSIGIGSETEQFRFK